MNSNMTSKNIMTEIFKTAESTAEKIYSISEKFCSISGDTGDTMDQGAIFAHMTAQLQELRNCPLTAMIPKEATAVASKRPEIANFIVSISLAPWFASEIANHLEGRTQLSIEVKHALAACGLAYTSSKELVSVDTCFDAADVR